MESDNYTMFSGLCTASDNLCDSPALSFHKQWRTDVPTDNPSLRCGTSAVPPIYCPIGIDEAKPFTQRARIAAMCRALAVDRRHMLRSILLQPYAILRSCGPAFCTKKREITDFNQKSGAISPADARFLSEHVCFENEPARVRAACVRTGFQ